MTASIPRAGLVGTGPWAVHAHAAALRDSPDVDFVSLWGRNPEARDAAAAEFSVEAFSDFEAFLDTVDVVCFAVPPFVQAELGLRALNAGKHVLFEKPLALTVGDAEALAEAAERNGVAALVYFTILFDPRVRSLLASKPDWTGGSGLWLGSALSDSNPFNTPWRRQYGALWDLAPHAISVLWAALGPVAAVTADHGIADMTHLVLHHSSGVTSTASITLTASDETDGFQTVVWGASGRTEFPVDDVDERVVLGTAINELVQMITSGNRDHPCGLPFGVDIVRVLDQAQREIDHRRSL